MVRVDPVLLWSGHSVERQVLRPGDAVATAEGRGEARAGEAEARRVETRCLALGSRRTLSSTRRNRYCLCMRRAPRAPTKKTPRDQLTYPTRALLSTALARLPAAHNPHLASLARLACLVPTRATISTALTIVVYRRRVRARAAQHCIRIVLVFSYSCSVVISMFLVALWMTSVCSIVRRLDRSRDEVGGCIIAYVVRAIVHDR